MIPGIFLQT